MYVIRRVWITKPREARRVASLAAEVGSIYEKAGRDPVRISFNGGTLPGDINVVTMEWTADTIDSPYRADNELPDTGDLGQRIRDLTVESRIEFYELLTPDKALPLD